LREYPLASPDGSAVAFEGSPFSSGLAAGANEYVAKRDPGGWQTSALSGPQLRDDVGQGFKAFSSDLSHAVLYQIEPSLTPEAPTDFANLYLEEVGKAGLTTLITTEPPSRLAGDEGPDIFRVNYAGANAGTASTPPFSHVIFQANDALSEEVGGIAPEAPPVGPEETNLYEWSGGELHLINVLPGNNAAAANAVIGSGGLTAKGGVNFEGECLGTAEVTITGSLTGVSNTEKHDHVTFTPGNQRRQSQGQHAARLPSKAQQAGR
jgi:hypothetical protein